MALADEIAVKLGLSTAEFKAALKDADASVQGFSEHTKGGLEGLFGSLEHRVLGMRHLSGAIATALGLNLEKIAEHVASVITGISETDKKAYEELSKLSDKATELALKNMRDRLTEEQKLQLLLTERDRLQKQLDESTAHTAEQLEKQAETRIELETKISEIQAIQDKQAKELAKTEAEQHKAIEEAITKEQEAARKEFEAHLATLDIRGKIAALYDDMNIKQAMITAGVLEGKNAEAARSAIEKDRLEIIKTEAEYNKESAKLDKELAKLAFEKLSPEEQIAALTRERAQLVKEIKDDETDENKVKADKIRIELIDTEIAKDQLSIAKQYDQTQAKIVAKKLKQAEIDAEIARLTKVQADNLSAIYGFTIDSDPARQRINEENQRNSANESTRREIAALEEEINRYQQSGAKVSNFIIQRDREREDALRARLNNDDYVFNPNYTDSLGKGIAASAFHSQASSPEDIQTKALTSMSDNLAALTAHVATAFPLN